MHPVEIPLPVGFVTSALFIVFDLIMLSIADNVLARVACLWFYHRINGGQPMAVTCADIPCVTTNLLGRFFHPANLVFILVKVALLSVVFFLNTDTGSKKIPSSTRSSFKFNPSFGDVTRSKRPKDDEQSSLQYSVPRPHAQIKNCRVHDGDNVTFYRLGFELRYGVVLDTEMVSGEHWQRHEIDASTLQCLLPVDDDNATSLLNIVGCSPERPGKCEERANSEKNISIKPRLTGNFTRPRRHSISNYSYTALDDYIVRNLWPEYPEANVSCVSIMASDKVFESCLLIAPMDNNTLVENWTYDAERALYRRTYAGPLFKGRFHFSVYSLTFILDRPWEIRKLNWIHLSAAVLAETMVYEPRNFTFVRNDSRTVTTIETRGLVAASVALFLVVVIFIGVVWCTRHDLRPRFNTIDGLSSILREEYRRTGHSMGMGHTAVLGYSTGGGLENRRLGPIDDHAGEGDGRGGGNG